MMEASFEHLHITRAEMQYGVNDDEHLQLLQPNLKSVSTQVTEKIEYTCSLFAAFAMSNSPFFFFN
jgi:hypothetical protein